MRFCIKFLHMFATAFVLQMKIKTQNIKTLNNKNQTKRNHKVDRIENQK